MKQKAKIYKGKRIVIGDKNLVTKSEIHVNDIPQEGGESGGGGGEEGTAKVVDALHFFDYQSPIWVNLVTKEYNISIENEEGIPVIHSGELNKESTIAYDAATGVITIPHNKLGDIHFAPCATMVVRNLGDEENPWYQIICGDILISNVNFYKNGEILNYTSAKIYVRYNYGRTEAVMEYEEDGLFYTWEGNCEKVTFDITFPSGNTYKMEATGDIY